MAKLERYVACLVSAGYEAARVYLSAVLTTAILKGQPIDPAAYTYMRMLRTAAARGLGEQWRVQPFTEELIARLAEQVQTPVEQEMIDITALAYFFLLRIEEALKIGKGHLTLPQVAEGVFGRQVKLYIAYSKTDQGGA